MLLDYVTNLGLNELNGLALHNDNVYYKILLLEKLQNLVILSLLLFVSKLVSKAINRCPQRERCVQML